MQVLMCARAHAGAGAGAGEKFSLCTTTSHREKVRHVELTKSQPAI